MSNIALARRYRPHTFDEMVGQPITVQALTHALETKRLHHAYLFTGTRGIGKTSVARILAKCLNCEQGISAKPCGVCGACSAIDNGSFVDLIEVDAASRTKVEDTRELLENVQYLPTQGRFKIYLIDEVHMLSNHSFNALLKTLEEPPAHVKFLLATTDPQKLPMTILSRCLEFHLQRASSETVIAYLEKILHAENIAFEKEALTLLGIAADGSLRDAVSLLEQAINYSKENLTKESVSIMLGLSQKEQLWTLLEMLVCGNGQAMLAVIDSVQAYASDFSSVLAEFLSLIHQVAIAQIVPGALSSYDANAEKCAYFAEKITPETVQLYYQIGLQGQRDLPYAPTPKMGFEMILLRMLAFQPVSVVEEAVAPEIVKPTPQVITEPAKREPTPQPSSPSHWSEVIKKLPLKGLEKVLAEHCVVKTWNDTTIILSLDESQKVLATNKRYQERLAEMLSQHLGKAIQLSIEVGGLASEVSPAIEAKNRKYQNELLANQNAKTDLEIQDLIHTFNADIEAVVLKDE